MSPRVLFVDHVGVLGGAELSLLDIATHYGEQCRVVLFQDGPFRKRLIERGVEVRVIQAPPVVTGVSRGSRAWRDILAIPGVFKLAWRLVEEAKMADTLYANSQKAMLISALAGLIARRPVIWHLRDILSADHFSKHHLRIATGTANRLVAKVIANSEATKKAFVEAGGKPSLACVVYNGVDARQFDDISNADVRVLRSEFGWEDTKLVGIFGRLARWKGQHILIEAISLIPGVSAVIVGAALFPQDQAYERELHSLTRQLGIENRIHFLGFRTDVPALMKMVDVVVHASTAPEPFGRVIVEGLLAGKPVVASAEGGAAEIVSSGLTGLLIPSGDPQSLRRAMQKMFDSPDYASGLANRGEKVARSAFDLHSMFSGINSVIVLVNRRQ